MGPGLDMVGKRMTIRLHRAEGGYRDIVGVLESPTDLRKRDGSLAHFDPDDIAIWREIMAPVGRAGHGAPLSQRIREIEVVANETWPAKTQEQFGGWLLRSSGKFTMRANSVLPLGQPPYGEPGKSITEAISHVVDFYRGAKLTPVFHIPLPTYSELDTYLAEQGWTKRITADVMVADIDLSQIVSKPGWEIADSPTDEWLHVQEDFGVAEIMKSAPALYAALRIDSHLVAVGRAAIYENWSVFSRFFVKKEFRGQGFGRDLIRYLSRESILQGATKTMLQVDSANSVAIRLYENEGFRRHHSYVYRTLDALAESKDAC